MTGRTRRPGTTDRCPGCGAPVIRQLVDVLNVTADAEPIPPGTDADHRGPDRLIWCLPPARWSTPRLRWIYRSTHPKDCPHPHHPDHQCPARQPGTLF